MRKHEIGGCDGNLSYSHTEQKQIKVKKVNHKTGDTFFSTKTISKDMYQCDKCGDLVNIIICPSFKDLVILGKIRVPYWRYKRIKKEYDELEKIKNESSSRV